MSDCRHNTPNRGPDTGDVQTQRQQLDEQDRERLLDQLIDCLYSIDGDTDTSAIDRCLEELEAAGALCDDKFDVEQGLKDFHERFSMAFENNPPPETVQKKTQVCRPMVRIAIIAAALCACLIATAQASGFDIIAAIARWTSEQFSFMKVDEKKKENLSDVGDFLTLQAALDDTGVTEQLAPTWFPEGTELTDLQVRTTTDITIISATYKLDKETFFVSIQNVLGAPHMEIEINDSDIESYWAGGIEHHIMNDVKQAKVTWYNGAWECRISGNLNREDLLLMIDSIYED